MALVCEKSNLFGMTSKFDRHDDDDNNDSTGTNPHDAMIL